MFESGQSDDVSCLKLELTELESSLKLRLTIGYHKYLNVSESAYTFTVYAVLSDAG